MTNHSKETFLPLMRELAETFQAFEQFSDAHVREMGLTPPQFDVVATLGNTEGMTARELSEKTLITKGTLTGVIDRLIDKGLVSRTTPPGDRRCVTIRLTAEGDALFQRVFPAHMTHMQAAFACFTATELGEIRNELRRLGDAFRSANLDYTENSERAD
ncbi:MarR family transcriptional regulator [Crenobacter sp. SG2305]|uniref:MarR family winged helix-turn-helix transcriptional regulator n=1 Tax=Crenobacter oryzisoli TaxID=3056844 RepID=UPI0025AB0DF2|nr:MarR family transcriptional regulator [Crenobacter sp. SG2305]MDN0082664.1 MarR family transcriptional regulator [Crenobacter sp. SG2305]